MSDLRTLYGYSYPKPKNKSTDTLSPQEKLMLDMFIFMPNTKFHEIYKMVYPTAKGTPAKIRDDANQILISYAAEAYLKERKAEIDSHIGLTAPDGSEIFDIELKDIPDNAEEILMKKAWKEIEDKGLDSKAAEWWFKDLLKDKDASLDVAPPLRILAESCHSCRYKAMAETELYDGCKFCKYKKYANKNGVTYTYKNQLDLPKDFYTKNNIKKDEI